MGVFFDHTVSVSVDGDATALTELAALAEKYVIVDIQATETLASFIYGFAAGLKAPHRGHRWATRLTITNKVAISSTLATEHILVPPTLLATEATPAQAVEKLGLPIVLKDRVGYGGTGVHIAHTLADLEKLLAVDSEQDRFYETYVAGEAISYAGLATEDGLTAASTYAILSRVNPMAPADAVEGLDLPELLRQPRRLHRNGREFRVLVPQLAPRTSAGTGAQSSRRRGRGLPERAPQLPKGSYTLPSLAG